MEHYTTAVVGLGKTMATKGHMSKAMEYRPGGEGGTGIGAPTSIQIYKAEERAEARKETVKDIVAHALKSDKEHEATHSKKLANTQVKGWVQTMRRGVSYEEYLRHKRHILQNVEKWGLVMPNLPPAPPRPKLPPPPAKPPASQPYKIPAEIKKMSHEQVRREISEMEHRQKTYGTTPARSRRLENMRIWEAQIRTGKA
jgi:hypothetical protein